MTAPVDVQLSTLSLIFVCSTTRVGIVICLQGKTKMINMSKRHLTTIRIGVLPQQRQSSECGKHVFRQTQYTLEYTKPYY